MKAVFYTTFALVAFAFNSILCRLALKSESIDPVGFTLLRLFSGAFVLGVIFAIVGKGAGKELRKKGGNWLSAFFLFSYAICFSLAYISLATATGALLLFGCVQATMLIAALVSGERPGFAEWIGLVVALGGLVYLVFPGLTAPPLFHSALMAAAGVSWGFYTLRGKGLTDPLADTAGNFLRTLPMVGIAALPFLSAIKLSQKGVVLAVLSGALASGIGYAVWYAALKFHSATRAAILQLSVPALASLGGVILLAETISWRLFWASVLILGGVGLAIFGRRLKKS
ncbi:MAG: DMT family transporter [Pyrinomonadaceae bacterium]